MITTKKVLAELGAEDKEMLTVYNKVDLVTDENTKLKANLLDSARVFISAQTGEGKSELFQLLENIFKADKKRYSYLVPLTCYALVARLKSQGELSSEETTCLLYTSPSPRDATLSRMPSSA